MGVHQQPAWEMFWEDEESPPPTFCDAPVLVRPKPDDPCPEHPYWPRTECNFCIGVGGVHGVRREFMTQAERREIYEKTGSPVESRSDMRRVYREKGLREAEKGEHVYETMDALKESAESGRKLDPRYAGHTLNPFGAPKKSNFNWRDRYAYYKQKYGER